MLIELSIGAVLRERLLVPGLCGGVRAGDGDGLEGIGIDTPEQLVSAQAAWQQLQAPRLARCHPGNAPAKEDGSAVLAPAETT